MTARLGASGWRTQMTAPGCWAGWASAVCFCVASVKIPVVLSVSDQITIIARHRFGTHVFAIVELLANCTCEGLPRARITEVTAVPLAAPIGNQRSPGNLGNPAPIQITLITLITLIISYSGACSETLAKLQDDPPELKTYSLLLCVRSALLACGIFG